MRDTWFKSRYSSSDTACVETMWKSARCTEVSSCVEVATAPGVVAVRDSKDPDGPVLEFPPDAWDEFIGAIKRAEFDA